MKKQALSWMALAVLLFVWTASGQVRTITLNQNYTGAPGNTTRTTDEYGNIMGAPLPTPTRNDSAFTGWFTARTGGTRVLVGALGTRFTRDSTIYARWTGKTARTVSQTPAAMKENFDWLKNVRHNGENGGAQERVFFTANGSVRDSNFIFDQIWAGNGTINWAVRWESDRVVTLAERRAAASTVYEAINGWTRPLIGFEDWPFEEIPVTIVGWAVSNMNYIQDPQPNENFWVNNQAREPSGTEHATLMTSPPANVSRFINRRTANYQYAGGLHARYDLLLWATKGFGGGAGGDWGSRQNENASLNGGTVLNHEVGHGFGMYDFYAPYELSRPPATTVPDGTGNRNFGSGELRTVMIAGGGISSPANNAYDQWAIRYYWNWVKNGSPATRFRTPTTVTYVASAAPTNRTFDAAPAGYDNSDMAQMFTIANTGIGHYTNVTAAFARGTNSNFELAPGAGLSNIIGAECKAAVSVRPKVGLAQRASAYTDTLRIRGDNNLTLNIPLSFSVTNTTGVTAVAAHTQQPQFKFDNRGTLRYSLGDAVKFANLKIYDARGRVVRAVILDGAQNMIHTNINVASQMLIWKVEINGRVADQGRMNFVSR